MELNPSELLKTAVAHTAGIAKERGIRLEIGWTTTQAIMADPDRPTRF